MRTVRVAVLDMNNGFANQGIRCITEILHRYFDKNNLELDLHFFNVREKSEVPDISFEIYISSGGPGSPFDEEGWIWENKFFKLINNLYKYNLTATAAEKKYFFFICHSFQLACRFFKLGKVCLRKSTSFGVLPITKLEAGEEEPVFAGLDNPFYAVDSRDFQVIEPDKFQFDKMGARILAIEKERPHIPLERAMMAIRFSNEMIGTQFHPEADATSMHMHLLEEDKREKVIAEHGEEKYYSMIEHLEDPDKIMQTQRVILPNFLDIALELKH